VLNNSGSPASHPRVEIAWHEHARRMRRRADERPSAPPPREKYLYIVHGVEFLATQRRRIASPRTCGALRACDHWETFSPLVNHRKMTRCAPRRRKRTRCRRYNARDRLKGPSLITRRLHSRGVAIILGASRICRVSCYAFWGSLSSSRGHRVVGSTMYPMRASYEWVQSTRPLPGSGPLRSGI